MIKIKKYATIKERRNDMSEEILEYQTSGTCCQLMQVKIEDNKVVDAQFLVGATETLKESEALF